MKKIHFLCSFTSLRFPVHPSKGFHWCSWKRLFELSEASDYWCFEKITASKISAYSQQNIQGGILFNYTRRSSWDFSKKLFRTKSMLGKVGAENLKALQFAIKKLRNRAFPGHFTKFSKYFLKSLRLQLKGNFSKFLEELLFEHIAIYSVFSVVICGTLDNKNCYKGALLKAFSGNLPNFQNCRFANISWKIYELI